MDRVYNILYIDRFVQFWGSQVSLFELLSRLDREQFKPFAALPEQGPLPGMLRKIGVRTVITPLHKIGRNPLPYFKTVYNLYRIIKENEIDLVHANCDLANQYGLPAARLTGVPIVAHTRNILTRRGFSREFLAFSDGLIANSKATAASFRLYLHRRELCRVIHNGVDLGKFVSLTGDARRSFRKKIGLKDNVYVIAVVGRITPVKGQDIFLKAFAQVVRKRPNSCALIVGEPFVGDPKVDTGPEYLRQLQALSERLGVHEKVRFTGFVDDMVGLMDSIELLVLPSLAEPFGRVLIEAMAMQRPVVAVKVGGPLEVVDDGVTGLLVSPKDSNELAQAILRIAGNKRLARQFGRQGRKRVERLFGIQENVRKTEQVYREILSQRNKRRRWTMDDILACFQQCLCNTVGIFSIT